MKIEVGDDPQLRKLGELIGDIEVAMLTTHATDGSLVSRPLESLKLDANGELVFFTASDSRKVEELTASDDANLSYADAAARRYVSVRGRTRIDRDGATIDELWSPLQKIFFPAGKNDPNLMVLRLRVRDAAYWESVDSLVGRAIDFSQAMLRKGPSDLGEHGRIEP